MERSRSTQFLPATGSLSVSGAYIKSVMQGVREVFAADIEIAAQAGLPLKIVVGTKFATLNVTTSSQAPSAGQVFVVFWGDRDRPIFPVSPDGSGKLSPQGGSISVAPGRYLVCAFVGIQPWMAVAASASGRVLRKALEDFIRPDSSPAKRGIHSDPAKFSRPKIVLGSWPSEDWASGVNLPRNARS